MNRKKKLRIFQILFFTVGLIIILFTISHKKRMGQEKIISSSLQKEIDLQIRDQSDRKNVFYNVKYSGLDLEGNTYTIFSKEAINSETNANKVILNGVKATFYFKDDTVLKITSGEGDYDNASFDIVFRNNVEAIYGESKLYAGKAEFLNSKNFLIISNNVKVLDNKGSMSADKLIFDIKDKTLKISSLNNNLIKSEAKLKWRKDLEF